MCLRCSIGAVCVCMLGAALGSLPAAAGPLNPPPGAVASTGKALAEVEPRIAVNAANTPGDADHVFRITQPGSYYLTDNMAGVVGKHGVGIAAGGVTLDLNGFRLAGDLVAGSGAGVHVDAAGLSDIAVVNGSLSGWSLGGVRLGEASNSRVEGVLASGNGALGIIVGTGSTISNCSASGNGSDGIRALSGSTISNCSAWNNIGNGIWAIGGCTIANCSGYNNTENGINASNGCTITGCTGYSNDGNGLTASTGCTVVGCSFRLNSADGIECTLTCVIRGNACSNNGNGGDGAGIHATGGDNRIEGNTCTNSDRGVDVDAGGNIIIGNTCSNNASNWEIAANNFYGPIIIRAGALTPAVSGDGGVGSMMGTTDPFANFSY